MLNFVVFEDHKTARKRHRAKHRQSDDDKRSVDCDVERSVHSVREACKVAVGVKP